MDEKPPPVGAPLPPFKECPQAAIVPSACNAANALWVDAIETKPATDGAPLPPYELCPHAAIVPFGLSAAKLYWFVAMETKVPVGAPLPPFELSPHATIEPSPARAAVAYRLTLCPLHEPGHSLVTTCPTMIPDPSRLGQPLWPAAHDGAHDGRLARYLLERRSQTAARRGP